MILMTPESARPNSRGFTMVEMLVVVVIVGVLATVGITLLRAYMLPDWFSEQQVGAHLVG